MQIESFEGLSVKSRGILYRLKQSLVNHKLGLEDLICIVFQYRKQSFKPKQFQKIIKKFDQSLALSDIDRIFDQLDDNKNGIVFYNALENSLKNITQEDNPVQVLNRISKIKIKTEEDAEEFDVLINLKDILVGTEYYRQILGAFSSEQNGYLTQQNFNQLLINFGYDNEAKRQKIIQTLFKGHANISVPEILERVGLDNDGIRIDLKEQQINNNNSMMENESEFIKKHKKQENKMKQSLKIKKNINMNETMKSFNFQVSDHTPGTLPIEEIPQTLRNYFNYGSELEEGFAAMAQGYIESNVVFFDTENPGYSKAGGFVHIAEVHPHYQLFNKAKSVVHRNRKGLGEMMEPKDIIQGNVGDCYFLSALAAIVEQYPQLVYRLFVLEKNPSHIFGVKLFIDGVWKTIPLDGTLPVNRYGMLCGAQPHNNEIWVLLLEKAWAKEFGSYDRIHGGLNQEGLVAFTGAPNIVFSSKDAGVLKRIQVEFGKGSIITCATSRDVTQLTHHQQQQLGVFAGHAYTILNVYTNLPYKNGEVTLLKVRNPWGKKAWKKDWSFNSSKWTKQLKQMVNFTQNPNDGTFFISYNDFVIYFDHINVSKVKLSYVHSWETNQGNRYEFYENRITVQKAGDYFFTVYQQNPRKNKTNANLYKKSKSYLFLAKIQKQTAHGLIKKLQTIGCKASAYKDNTIETTLEPGNYIVVSSVTWDFYEVHPYNLTIYGPSKVAISEGVVTHPETLRNIIESRSQFIDSQGGSKITTYPNLNISKSFYCSIEEGIGYMLFKNKDQTGFKTIIQFNPCVGIQFIPPHSLPLKVTILPFENVLCAFLVNPQGFSYQIRQKYLPVSI